MTRAMLHLSIPVADVDTTLRFYRDLLGCSATRVQEDRIDFEFFGHHLVAQLSPEEAAHRSLHIGDNNYPLRHFGVIVEPEVYDAMLGRLRAAGYNAPMTSLEAGVAETVRILASADPYR